MTVTKLGCAGLIVAMFLGACTDGPDSAGIDGTGMPVPSIAAYGSVTATDHFSVNGTRYDTAVATVTIDGRPGKASDIALGDIAQVSAKTDPNDAAHVVADNVIVDDAVEGSIASIDMATSTLVAVGQTIRVTPATLFDASVLPPSLAGLAVGQTIEVAGFRASNGDIFASRVELKTVGSNLETTGKISNHQVAARRFLINGLVVSYAAAASSAVTALRNGDVVEVRGSSLLPGGELAATYVARALPLTGGAGDRVDIEGYVTTFNAQAPATFDVAGVPARTTSQTVVEDVALALDAKVAVKGTLDSSGTVVASDLRRSGYPGPISGPYAVVGQVFDAYSGGVPDASVNLWVQQGGGGYSWWWANGRLASNSGGEFIASNIPAATRILLFGVKPGFVQPCAVDSDMPPSGVVQVELVAESTLAVLDPPRPLLVRGTVLTGTVFETVNGVRQPVAGAALGVDTDFDLPIANTKTDLQGRFFLCNLPRSVVVYVNKTGFASRNQFLPDPATASPLELEVQRR